MDTGHRAWGNLKETSLRTLPAEHNINRGSARHGASIAQTKFSAVPRLLKPYDDLVLYLQRLQAEQLACKCAAYSIYMDTGHRAWENLKETSLPTLPAKHNINRGLTRYGASITQTKCSAVPRLSKPCNDLVLYLQRLQAERSASKCNLFRRPPT